VNQHFAHGRPRPNAKKQDQDNYDKTNPTITALKETSHLRVQINIILPQTRNRQGRPYQRADKTIY